MEWNSTDSRSPSAWAKLATRAGVLGGPLRRERGANAGRGSVAGRDGDFTGEADARGEFANQVDYLVHRGASSFGGSTIPMAANASMAALRRPARHGAQQSSCSHAWRAPTPIGSRMLRRRLGPAAAGAAIWVGVGMGGVEKLDDDDLVGGALGLSLRQIAHALDDDRPVLELTKPAVSIRGRVIRGFQ